MGMKTQSYFEYDNHEPQDLFAEIFQYGDGDPIKNILIEIIDKMHESVLIVDKNTKICFVNESYCKMFRIDKTRIIGRHLAKFEPLARCNDVIVNGEPVVGAICHVHSANIDVFADITPLFKSGTIIGAVACMKNVTELVSLNQELAYFKKITELLQGTLEIKEEFPPAFKKITGQSGAFMNVLHIASRVAPTEAAICIVGESGVGKEVITDAIHKSSNRSDGPLIKINCAAIPESLLESELFGYEHGAFTGAKSGGKQGKFELAHNGTIFLDEIGDMPITMQVKLLRVLQERVVERIGGNKSIKLNFRLVCATSKDLQAMVKGGSFREDLYYRINVIPLNIPPLRERSDDIILLANLFLEESCRAYGKKMRFSPEVIPYLNSYDWPGNIRELKNLVEQVVILTPGDTLLPNHLPPKLLARQSDPNNDINHIGKLSMIMDNTEKEAVLMALRLTNNNRTRAMEMLGISRRAFYKKLEKHRISL